jgi:hypothetical protein
MMTWWADYLDANREKHITPYDFAHRDIEEGIVMAREGVNG